MSKAIAIYINKQLQTFVNVDESISFEHFNQLKSSIESSIEQYYACVKNNTFLTRSPINLFDVRVYSIFLIIVAKTISIEYKSSRLADRIYLLNRYLHGCDIYHKVTMPKEFFLNYAGGIVLVNTTYGNKLVVYQGVTVGATHGKIPVIGDYVLIMPNCLISGDSHIGSNVTISAGVKIINQDVPSNSLVFQHGNGRDLVFKDNKRSYLDTYFFNRDSSE